MRTNRSIKTEGSFTLVELLVVIGILSILTAAVVIVLNPAELLKQSRDSKRTTDLANLNNAIKLLLTQDPDVNLGAASTVYISLSDSSSTCGSYSLPVLPSGWQYRCAAAANATKMDGTGWVPVNFSSTGNIASLPALPIDPQNSIQNHYSYVSGGSWQLAAAFESSKYAAKEANDGGPDPATYEIGSNVTLAPFVNGLVGYWNFDEGTGTAAKDASGNGNNGSLLNGATWIAGKSGSSVNIIGGGGNGVVGPLVSVPDSNSLDLGYDRSITISLWLYNNSTVCAAIIKKNPMWEIYRCSSSITVRFNGASPSDYYGTTNLANGEWYHVAVTRDASSSKTILYINGQKEKEWTFSLGSFDATGAVGVGAYANGYYSIDGRLDDVRIYNRALSAAEIQAIYNATK